MEQMSGRGVEGKREKFVTLSFSWWHCICEVGAVGWEVLLPLQVPPIAPRWAVHVWPDHGLSQPLSLLICRLLCHKDTM